MKKFIFLLSATLSYGVFAQPSNEEIAAFVSKAKSNITQGFKDPQSAQFKGLFVGKNGAMLTLCGEVNAKNSYGAYVGFQKFFATSEPMLQQIAGGVADTHVYDGMASRMCVTKVADVN